MLAEVIRGASEVPSGSGFRASDAQDAGGAREASDGQDASSGTTCATSARPCR